MRAPDQTRFVEVVARFRAWAAGELQDGGEWECNYEHWGEIHAAFRVLVANGGIERWPHDLVETVLYAIARDNEVAVLVRELPLAALPFITEHARAASDPEARWQLANRLGQTPIAASERLLLQLVDDQDEYVRRCALASLGRIHATGAGELALHEWATAPDDMPWTKMNALGVLRRVGAPAYAAKLAEARASTNEYLSSYAERLDRGEYDHL